MTSINTVDSADFISCVMYGFILVKERILDSDSKDSNHLGFFRKDSQVCVRKISFSNPGFGFEGFKSFSLSSQMWLI